ncbi:hypothetical protein FE782_05625 [Paenibacillus antri]|uniref:Uncharacterized protein n=1 Tax=Paenibacillus antri TaxID=2582848 RepID=A0A5R9GH28_9BACL|nr:hypothetical protein [Paenibacillus antri]TLS53746.1 hypothetical protein FE782_05625 [Paenibacillus antri]
MKLEKKPTKAWDSTPAEIRPGDEDAAKANAEMERRFYGRTDGETPAEAVDFAELFRNES